MLVLTDITRIPAAIDADGAVEGYASLFGEIDQARDMVMPGAFAASLRVRGVRRIPMLFQHDPAEPVGVWLDIREDGRGLYARGRLIPEVVRGRELLALLRAGATDGLLMTYFGARFGVLGVYVSGRSREKVACATGSAVPSPVGELVKAFVKKK